LGRSTSLASIRLTYAAEKPLRRATPHRLREALPDAEAALEQARRDLDEVQPDAA